MCRARNLSPKRVFPFSFHLIETQKWLRKKIYCRRYNLQAKTAKKIKLKYIFNQALLYKSARSEAGLLGRCIKFLTNSAKSWIARAWAPWTSRASLREALIALQWHVIETVRVSFVSMVEIMRDKFDEFVLWGECNKEGIQGKHLTKQSNTQIHGRQWSHRKRKRG